MVPVGDPSSRAWAHLHSYPVANGEIGRHAVRAALLAASINEAHRGDAAHVHGRRVHRATLCDPDFWTATLTIANAALGTGLLVSAAFRNAGVVGGAVMTCALVVVCAASLYVIMTRMGWAQAIDRDVKGFGALVRWGVGARLRGSWRSSSRQPWAHASVILLCWAT